MKLKLAALTLIAFVCWLVPLKTLAQETYQPKTKTEQITSPISDLDSQVLQLHKEETPPVHDGRPLASSSVVLPSISGHSGRHYSKEEVQQLIKDYSTQYGISPAVPLRIARCESGFNQFAKNKTSTASGVFQFLNSTWATKPLAQQGKSVWDADANVHTAVWLISLGKTSMWVCK